MFNWFKSFFGSKTEVTENTPVTVSEHPSNRYLEEDAIINDIIRKMSDEDQKTWKEAKESELVLWHLTTGREIRNKYHLWEADNPFTDTVIADSDNHPDQVSARIMKKVWQVVNA